MNPINNNVNSQPDKKYISSKNKNKTNPKINKNKNDTKTIIKTEIKKDENNFKKKNSNQAATNQQNNKKASIMINNENKNEKNLKNNNSNSANSIELNNKNQNKNENNLKDNNSSIEQTNNNSSIKINDDNKIKKEKNEAIDLKQKFAEIKEFYREIDKDHTYEEYKNFCEKIVKGLSEILKDDSPASDFTLKVCNFVDLIHKEAHDVIWNYVDKVENKNILFSFLKELAMKKLVPTIDKIFMSGEGHYPLVNRLSCNYKKEFSELFDILPTYYQNDLRFRTISYSEGDKDYACLLLGGTCLMGF
jgi:hypothetical protein